jgi:hypothetical protein
MWGGTAESRGAEMRCNCIPRSKYTTHTQRDRDKAPLDIGGQPRRSKKKEEKRRERAWRVSVFFISVFCSS